MSARFVVSKTECGIPESIQESAEDTKNVEIIVKGDKELGMKSFDLRHSAWLSAWGKLI